MKTILLTIIAGLAILTIYTIEKTNKPRKHIYLKLVEEDFHEDFDSTYYYNGCKTDTFKLNHKCKSN